MSKDVYHYRPNNRKDKFRCPTSRTFTYSSPTHEYEPSPDEIEFMMAMDLYKRNALRPFPTWGEVLQVVRTLGYHKG
jgi:hypothetical protein